jgi:hypothetical protein
VTKRIGDIDYPVTELELDHAVYSGVQQKAQGADLVTLQEEHDARLERGIGVEAWMVMDVYEKALLIAARRNRMAIQNQQAEAEIRKSIADSKRKGKK